MKFLLLLLLILALLCPALVLAGGQRATPPRHFFWARLYGNGDSDLYCGVQFKRGERLTVEHVYAADWIA